MAQPYIGEIRMFAGTFAPLGWAFCDGSPMPISENEALFQLIGTTYGGDGESTFNLPNLASRIPIHQSSNSQFVMGQMGGVEEVTLSVNQIPVHNHQLLASIDLATSNNVQNNVAASIAPGVISGYGTDPPTGAIDISAISPVGGSQPHTNLAPYLCISYIISLYGIFPSPT